MKHFLLLSYLMSVLSAKVVTNKGRIENWHGSSSIDIIYFFLSNRYWYLQNLPADCSCGEERREVCKVSSDPGGMDYIWNGRVTKVDTNYICKPTQRVSSNLWGKSVPLDGQVGVTYGWRLSLWRESDCFQGKSSLVPDPSVEFSTLFFCFHFEYLP